MRKRLIFIAPLAILGIAVFMFLGGEIVKLLWNWLAPSLFGWREITFWEGLGLLALCRILFGGFGKGGMSHGRGGIGSRIGDRVGERLVDRLGERFEAMSPEEKERFRQRIRDRFGFGSPAGDTRGSGSGAPFGTE